MRTAALAQEVLGLVRFVRHAPEGSQLDAQPLRSLFGSALGRMHREGLRLGLASRDLDDIGYALVALIDEVVLGRGGTLAYEWMREQLQLSIFGENTAGEGFFVRLAALRRDPARAEVLIGYYLALCLGFRGRYAVHGELAWQELVESVRLDLERSGAIVELALAPSGARPRDSIVQRSDGRVVLALGVAVAVISAVFYGGLWTDLAIRVAGVIGG